MRNSEKLVKILDLENKYLETIKIFVQSMSVYLDPDSVNVVSAEAEKIISISLPTIIGGIAKAYEEFFTEDEIVKIIEWYDSDIGKKMSSRSNDLAIKCDQIARDAINSALGPIPTTKPAALSNKNLN